jgi:hypothetical protein
MGIFSMFPNFADIARSTALRGETVFHGGLITVFRRPDVMLEGCFRHKFCLELGHDMSLG